MKLTCTFFLILTIFLTGCDNVIYKSEATKSRKAICRANRIYLHGKDMPKLYLGAQRSSTDNNRVYLWVTFVPTYGFENLFLLDNPKVMIKTYYQTKMTHQHKLTGKTYTAVSYDYNQYLKVSGNQTRDLKEDELEVLSLSRDILPVLNLGSLDEKAVIFPISIKDYNTLIDSDYIEFVIQTHDGLVRGNLNINDIKHLIEFKNECLAI